MPKKKASNGLKPLRGGTLALLTLAIAMATFMEVLDISIVNVSVQTIAGNLGVTPSEGTWTISAYSMSSAIMQPLSGFLARRYGEVRVFLISVALFIVFSILCGFAVSIQMLVVCRLLQGAVSGPMVPLSQSILLKNYPPEKKGMAMAFWAMTVVVAPIFGPILGGYITDNYSWPWIFFINVPVGVAAFIISFTILRDRETKTVKVPIDAIGLFLLVVGIGCLQFVLDNGNDNDWFGSQMILSVFIVAIIGLMFLIPWELMRNEPIVNLRLFTHRNFTIGVLALAFGMFAFFGSTVVLPRWLQDAMGYNATWAGLAVAPVGIFAFLLSPIVGKFSSKVDLRLLTALAFAVFSGASFWAADFSDQASYGAIVAPRLLQGVGVAMFFVPVNQIILSGLPPDDVASASGLANFFRTIASSISTAVTTTLYDHRTIFHHARLVENIQDGSPATTDYLTGLSTLGAQGDVAYAAVDRIITLQANTIALNDILWMFGIVFAAIVFFIWLAKPPFGAAGQPLEERFMKSKMLTHANGTKLYIVVLDPYEEAFSSIGEFAKRENIMAASISAVGAFKRAKVGWFDFATKKYLPIEINEQCEVLSVLGDIAVDDKGKPSVHAHAVLGLRDGTTRGGHLLEAIVNPTLELTITETPAQLRRTSRPELGIALIDLSK